MFFYIAIFVATFYLISYYFLRNPEYFFKRKAWKNDLANKALNGEIILNIAHRGGSRERLENTIEAFDNALK